MSNIGKSASELMAGMPECKPTAAELRESKKRLAASEREQLKPGSIWLENDPRGKPRYVRVMEIHQGEVTIKTVTEDGSAVTGSRITYAMASRFGGTRRGHYSFVRAS